MSSSPEIAKAKKGFVPANTQRSPNWAIRTFETWRKQRNAQSPGSVCPDDILLLDDTATLCHWSCVFCKEARREDGEPYTPRSITQLLSGIQRYIIYSVLYIISYSSRDVCFDVVHGLHYDVFIQFHISLLLAKGTSCP